MTDQQLLLKAGSYGLRTLMKEALRAFGRAEAEKVLTLHIANGAVTRSKAYRLSHKQHIISTRGTKCECCESNDWTNICHIVPVDSNDSSSGMKEVQRVMRQSDRSKVDELLTRCWLGCKTCHTNWDSVWSKTHERSRESFEKFKLQQKQRVITGTKTRAAQTAVRAKTRNYAKLAELYDSNVCQCCQQTLPTQYAHVYGEAGKEDLVTRLAACSAKRCVNEARKCVPLCRDCHMAYDKTHCYTQSQNPVSLEQHCRDTVERMGLGLEGHHKLDHWMKAMHERIQQVDWPQCELPIGYFGEDDPKPKCPSSKNYPLGLKDPGYKRAKSTYDSLRIQWNKRNVKGYHETIKARLYADQVKRRKEDVWTNKESS